MNAVLLFFIWIICTVLGGAYLGLLAAIAWRVAQWLI